MQVRAAVPLACLLEATARKPGNAHRNRDLVGLTYLQLANSAAAIGPAFANVADDSLGEIILAAIRLTRQVVDTNTNLGIVLLLAPLAKAAALGDSQARLGSILASTTNADAQRVFEAIRLAKPGGMGKANSQDVADSPTVDLLAAMQLAADRDSIARQYANGFADVFGIGMATLRASLAAGADVESAIVATFLTLMKALPDSLIARKRSPEEARHWSRRAADVVDCLASESAHSIVVHPEVCRLDRELIASQANPGTTADLTTAVLFCGLCDGTIQAAMPFGRGDELWPSAIASK